jgi:YgiT-type zinc finger domain-containing protein
MMPFTKCPLCGGELEIKKVEKIVRGGKHTAILNVLADVCLHCGEKLYTEETVRYFENIRHKLKCQETNDFQIVGNTFTVVSHH